MHHTLAVGGKLPHPVEDLPCLILLTRRQMLPGFHPVQHALLLLRRKTREVLQALPQHLLALRWQAAKARIVLQGAITLGGRQTLIVPQPIPGMTLPLPNLWMILPCRMSLSGPEAAVGSVIMLSQTGKA
jgi:hypothetical protein